MKKVLLIVLLCLVASLLASCAPTEPKEMLPYCITLYEESLVDYPDLPKSYIGACVANMQTGKASAFASLCDWEPLWAMIEESEEGVTITSRQECIQYLHNTEE
jgi:hypothetical protein